MRDLGRRRYHVGRQAARPQRRIQTFGRRRSRNCPCWGRFKCQKVRYGGVRDRNLEIGSIDNPGRERTAPSHMDSLRTVVGFVASCATAGTGGRSTQIFGARQFVA